jgi:galactitol-specific phosphotransferase system IIC component
MKVPTRVVILSNQTLLVEGVITRLQQHEKRVELHVVDLKQPDLLDKITEVQPTAIILDAKDQLVSQAIPLDRLLRDLPTLKVIRLDAQRLQTQLIRSEQYWVTEVCDLLELIEPTIAEAVGQPCFDCHTAPHGGK